MKPQSSWRLYQSSQEAWNAMLDAVNKAQRSIDIEQYIFTIDAVGQQFVSALIAARKRGVSVRLLCDSLGTEGAVFDSFHEEPLVASGVEVAFFNPIRYWKFWRLIRFWSWFLRDHSKLLIIDGEIGYTGGVGIRADMTSWRDSHVRVTGPVAVVMQESFNRMWQGARAGKRIIGGWPRPVYDSSFHFLMNFPKPQQRFVYYEFLRAIKSAQRYVYLTTPYFVPTRRFSRALKKAVKRGVDVRLMVPMYGDNRMVQRAMESYFDIGLRAGIRIFRYQPAMIHGKVAVADDVWASVGSANLDNLSFLLNYEGNLFSSDKAFIAAVKAQFEERLSQCLEVKKEAWRRRPLGHKALELLTWPLHRLL